jgi:hypothetical protein
MSDPSSQPNGPHEIEAPPALAKDLAALDGPRVFVPPEVDAAIRDAAGRRLRRRRWLRPAGALAAAAAVALVVSVYLPSLNRARMQPGSPVAVVREDVDASGRVDILDAFALARTLETGAVADPRWDVNGDGLVDHGDVDAIAAAAVSVTGGSV